jgi:hypothetical protein
MWDRLLAGLLVAIWVVTLISAAYTAYVALHFVCKFW